MLGTYRVETGRWQRAGRTMARDGAPIAHLLIGVDRLLYVASAALAACLLTMLLT